VRAVSSESLPRVDRPETPGCAFPIGSPPARVETGLVLASLAAFTVLAVAGAYVHPYPYYDDVAYLGLGQEVQALGGPWALLRALYAGRFAEANRHPLYLALLSLLAGSDEAYHQRAQVLGIGLGLVGLLATWWTTRRLLGAAVAALTLALLAVNGTLLEHSAREACEGLLLAVSVLAVGDILQGDAQPWRWPVAGAWAGLAYLCKGTGLFLPICFGLALLLARGWRALTSPSAWGFGLTFLTVASPLLVRNVRRFGSPFFNVNSRYLWANGLPDFAELFAPGADARLPHSLWEYLTQTSALDILRRLARGLLETTFQLADSLALVSPQPGGGLHVLWVTLGLVTVAVAVRAAWRMRSSWGGRFVLVYAAWSFAFFVVYNAVAGAARYFLPLAAVLIAVAARELLGWARDNGQWRPRRAAAILALPFAAVTAVALNPSTHQLPPGFGEAERWLRSHVSPGEGFAIDSRTRLQPGWLMPGTHQELVSTSWRGQPVSDERLLAHFRETQVRYLLIDGTSQATTTPGMAAQPRYFFYDTARPLPDGSVPLDGWPEPLRVAYAGAEKPRRWLVLTLESTP
jgi:hypothetical protein